MLYSQFSRSLFNKILLAATLTTTVLNFSACQNQANQNADSSKIAGNLRQLSQNERSQDFDQLLNLFKTYYGPYDYKERTLKINIEKEAARLKDLAVNAKTDEEFAGYVMQFGALLKDGHVQIGIQNTSSGISRYRIPILLTQVEDKTIVADIDQTLAKETNIEIGDEVLEVDGKAPADYMPIINKYEGWATKESEKHGIYALLSRPSYMTELIPQNLMANLKLKKADDSIYVQDIPWTLRKYNQDLDKMLMAKASADTKTSLDFRFKRSDEMTFIDSNIAKMGSADPFFINLRTKGAFGMVKVSLSDEVRKKVNLAENEKPPIFSALYKYKGKNILLMRMATYSPSDFKISAYMKTYVGLMLEYQNIADIMVLDQTHNPGGSYCADFYNLFAKEMDVQAVQQMNADRKWINALKVEWPSKTAAELPWDARLSQAMGLEIEKAYDSGKRLSTPQPLFTGSTRSAGAGIWEKPMLVLIDELAGSCGDIFPMLVKANKRAPLFGQKTMGLGGNVEEVGVLTNSRISIRLTRGQFSPFKEDGNYTDADLVENNGVSPDIEYPMTLNDVRGGYLKYMKTFSDEALKLLQEPSSGARPAEIKEAQVKQLLRTF